MTVSPTNLQTALLPGCSTSAVLHKPVRSRRGPLCRQAAAACAAAALLVCVLLAGPLRKKPLIHGRPPFCRKSSVVAVLSGPDANPQLLVWSGIGLHKAIFDDLHRLDMGNLTWTAEEAAPGPAPVSRWKQGGGQALPDGSSLLVVGGDAYTPGTRKHRYTNDIWRLSYPDLKWEQAAVDPDAPAPAPRRGHSMLLYVDALGVPHAVIFGGRTQHEVMLNDCWDAELRWPAATWRRVGPSQQSADAAPAPRKGHSAVLVPGAATPQMLVYGGREDDLYFNDTWQLDIEAGRWRRLEVGGEVPLGRDHHAAAAFNGRMLVFAGRSGETYSSSKPNNELWQLDLGSLEWARVEQTHDVYGVPRPRFEHAYAQLAAPHSNDSRLVIFGGQESQVKHAPCQLNDVWALSLTSLTWREVSPPRWCTKACRKAHS